MDQKPYEARLRGELLFAGLSLAPRNYLERIPPITDAAFGTEATEARVRDYSNRIASILATAMRPKAGLRLRKVRNTHAFTMHPSMFDFVQMFKELNDELANLHDADDAEKRERKIELIMRDELSPDHDSGQVFADKVIENALIPGERLGRLIAKFLPATWQVKGAHSCAKRSTERRWSTRAKCSKKRSLGEIVCTSDEVTYILRSYATYRIRGTVVADPTSQQLASMAAGDCVYLAPSRSKMDLAGVVYSSLPSVLPFGKNSTNAARALRDLELRLMCRGAARGSTPLFTTVSGRLYTQNAFDK
eukprot:594853-Pleurochrysis_carterae.AAC.2